MRKIVGGALLLSFLSFCSPMGLPGPGETPAGLPLKLLGVVTPEKGPALAVVRDQATGVSDLYHPGDPLPGGFTLAKVSAGHATIRDGDGVESTLRLETAREMRGKRVLRVAHFFDGQPMLMEAEEGRFFRGKSLTGFGIRGNPFERLFGVLELRDGDEILAINEEPAQGFAQATALLERALLDVPITVTVSRKREGQVFTYFLGMTPAPQAAGPSPESVAGAAPQGPALTSPEPFTGSLMVLGIVAGHAPRTMEVKIRATRTSPVVSLQIRPCQDLKGKFAGLELSEANPLEEAERVGLRVGDVITAIDGIRLMGLLQTLSVVRRAFKQLTIRAELTRDGVTMLRTLERCF